MERRNVELANDRTEKFHPRTSAYFLRSYDSGKRERDHLGPKLPRRVRFLDPFLTTFAFDKYFSEPFKVPCTIAQVEQQHF